MTNERSVRIRLVDPLDPGDDEVFERFVAVTTECGREVHGERHIGSTAAELRERWRLSTDVRLLALAACAGDAVLGAAMLTLPLKDNEHLGMLSLAVLPAVRRRGIGTRLLLEAEGSVVEAGRRVVNADSDRPLEGAAAADAFAARHGYHEALVDLRSELVLDDALDLALDRAQAQAAGPARDYEVLTWWDAVPEQWLDQRAALSARMSTDAPTGDRDLQPEVWDGARVAEVFAVAAAQGRRLVESVAVHRTSRELVAYSNIQVLVERPEIARQWDTLVRADHRGHRLGQLVKAANLRALRSETPAVRRVVTWNAESNEPMLRVNRALGFTPQMYNVEWQKELA